MHPTAFDDVASFVSEYLNESLETTIVEIGSADINGTIRGLFNKPRWTYYGLDCEAGPNVDIVADDPYHWRDIFAATVDVVICTQTLEHCPQPWRLVREMARILRPHGLLYCCVPNSMCFHGYPVDCFRIWPDGMVGLFADAGIEPVSVYTFSGDDIGCTTGIGRKPVSCGAAYKPA